MILLCIYVVSTYGGLCVPKRYKDEKKVTLGGADLLEPVYLRGWGRSRVYYSLVSASVV